MKANINNLPLLEKRFWNSIDSIDSNECWVWKGSIRKNDGYGVLGHILAHRFSHELFIGELPTDSNVVVDHTCHTEKCLGGADCPHRRCVNPNHLEAVSRGYNISRSLTKSSFRCGHPFTTQNTYTRKNGYKLCRTCHIEGQKN